MISPKFDEPIALMSYVDAITVQIGLASSIVIPLQRRTVSVVKPAAAIDLFSGGRLRLGIGTGWNHVEYEGLGMDLGTRARRFDEQLDGLRAVWTGRTVDFNTPLYTITDAGLYPLPLQRPIPLWSGGAGAYPCKGWARVKAVIQRIACKAEGWMPGFDADDTGAKLVERFRRYCRSCARDPGGFPIESPLLPAMRKDWRACLRPTMGRSDPDGDRYRRPGRYGCRYMAYAHG